MCVLDSTLVDRKLTEHMTTGWEPLPSDPSPLYEREANKLLDKCLREAGIKDSYVQGRLKSRHTQAPHLFPLAKDHKSGFPEVPLRVVQPVKGGALETLDLIFSRVLTQVLPDLPHRVKSADIFIQDHLRPLTNHLPRGTYQASFDVVSMYPSMPTCNRAMDYVLHHLTSRLNLDLLGFSPHHIVDMLKFVTKHTYAHAGNHVFRQTSGIGTGYHCSGAFAELVINETYLAALNQTPTDEKPLDLSLYVDDSHHLWASPSHCEKFLVTLNSIWPNIQFTREVASAGPNPGETHLSFLDVRVRLVNNRDTTNMSWELYQKATHSGTYLDYRSHCPTRTKLNIVRTEARRIINRCSSLPLALPHLEQLRANLLNSGYPNNQVSLIIAEEITQPLPPHTTTPPNTNTPPTQTTTDPQFVMKVPYTNEGALRIYRKAIKKSGLPIRVVTSSGRTIGSMAKSSYTRTRSPTCNCPYHLKDIPCDTQHVVYRATCNFCHQVYIGVSNRPLKDRLNDHETHTRLGNLEKSTLAEHANLAHFHHLTGTWGTRDYNSFFGMYTIEVAERARDTLGAYIAESRRITGEHPGLNKQGNNGFIF